MCFFFFLLCARILSSFLFPFCSIIRKRRDYFQAGFFIYSAYFAPKLSTSISRSIKQNVIDRRLYQAIGASSNYRTRIMKIVLFRADAEVTNATTKLIRRNILSEIRAVFLAFIFFILFSSRTLCEIRATLSRYARRR